MLWINAVHAIMLLLTFTAYTVAGLEDAVAIDGKTEAEKENVWKGAGMKMSDENEKGAGEEGAEEKVAFLTVDSSREKRQSFSGGLTKKHGDVVQKSAAVSPIATINRKMYCEQFGYDFVVGHDMEGVTDLKRSSRWNKVSGL